MIEYYHYLFEFIQQKYFSLLFDFSNEENLLLMDCLLFSKPFPQFQQTPQVNQKMKKEKSTENIKSDTIESVEGNEWRSVRILKTRNKIVRLSKK